MDVESYMSSSLVSRMMSEDFCKKWSLAAEHKFGSKEVGL